MTPTRCQHPGCPDLASRKVPEVIVRAGRRFCLFRCFCAAHVPGLIERTAPITGTVLPTHRRPTGQIHVPRTWEITGKVPAELRRLRVLNSA